MPFIQHPHLTDMDERCKHHIAATKQVISYVNTNPEDYMAGKMAALLVRKANQELIEAVRIQTYLLVVLPCWH